MAWLQDDITRDTSNHELVQCCAYMVAAANEFFRILRGEGIFLKGSRREAALHAGLEMNAPYLSNMTHSPIQGRVCASCSALPRPGLQGLQVPPEIPSWHPYG